mmetsp:Transcript_62324/g.86082  ORF Transcript_62324/g.86082 Transcript_62324/m.86082 type:complete len:284 (+) Transcript_62324:154-1005(+)
MKIKVTLPSEIDLPSKNIGCEGLLGTNSPELLCSVNLSKKTILVQNATVFSTANPGIVKIKFSNFRNPNKDIITGSFGIETTTVDGYKIDQLSSNMTVNFFCTFPCATCDLDQPDFCYSCYGGADERYFFGNKCISECPSNWYEREDNFCGLCRWPCVECDGGPLYCTECADTYTVVPDTGTCREVIMWPFPFACAAVFSLLVVIISEALTRGESRFKEAAVALISLPEFFSWCVFAIFLTHRIGPKGTSASAIFACFVYGVLNMTHMLLHRKQIIKESMNSY